jgi:NADPH-dependent glutamate synthase beta subunit-like oxidoreductase
MIMKKPPSWLSQCFAAAQAEALFPNPIILPERSKSFQALFIIDKNNARTIITGRICVKPKKRG